MSYKATNIYQNPVGNKVSERNSENSFSVRSPYRYLKSAFYDIPHNIQSSISAGEASKLCKQRGIVAVVSLINAADKYGRDGWVHMSKTYWEKLLGTNYFKVISYLKKTGVFQCSEKYAFGSEHERNNFCKVYRIAPEMLGGHLVTVSVGRAGTIDPLCEHVNNSKQLLSIDRTELPARKKEQRAKALASISDVTVSDEIDRAMPFNIIGELWNFSPSMRSYEKSQSSAIKLKKSLFRRGRRRYAATKEEMDSMVSKEVDKQWDLSIRKLHYKDSTINEGMGRMFHSVTNTPKIMMKSMRLKGEKIKMKDLKNSQMRLLSKGMEEGRLGGIVRNSYFSRLAASGMLYDVLAEGLKITRDDAKVEVLRTFFASHKMKSPCKMLMQGLFPEEIRLVDEYKMANGKNSIALVLQKMESDLFIKTIGYRLYELGIYFIPKHDSILYAESDEEVVSMVMAESMDAYFGAGTYAVSEEVVTKSVI